MIKLQSPSFAFKRHARVWLNWPDAAECIFLNNATQREAIQQHAARGLPFVARSRQPDDGADLVPLGLRMPRTEAARSLSFCVPASVIRDVDDAISLSEALSSENNLPPLWHDTLLHLQSDAERIGLTLRVYGSLAWQIASGTQYMADNSDIDLLVIPDSEEQARAALRLLDAVEKEGNVRLDGEMIFPDGRAVAWKELLANTRLVLVKTLAGVTLTSMECVWKQPAWH
ncbi:malonate decarboxylase holo-[acyl-carrier-protein] synthase [Herminiimonas arsenitoxidans]|uniref:malonate decarboxylase holo-[acyl-carrier-protein] synthase n=1 Tax=Herminiimonas arsenitoxidans TaxID=1809410 RepID=UPI000970B69C|nr:malonate decarboxylase holo-[acyl-carrier-protein] synthase [Herminiimonas arsenitoxidans]